MRSEHFFVRHASGPIEVFSTPPTISDRRILVDFRKAIDFRPFLIRHPHRIANTYGACRTPRYQSAHAQIIKAAIEVHRTLGPGLFESVYLACLLYELARAGLSYETQKTIRVIYKDVSLDCGFRVNLIVRNTVIVEVKSIAQIAAIHRAQLKCLRAFVLMLFRALRYLRLGGSRHRLAGQPELFSISVRIFSHVP